MPDYLHSIARSREVFRNWIVPRKLALKRFYYRKTRKVLSTKPLDTPIIINNYNRLACLRRLVDWLGKAHYSRIYVIDNKSTYGPLEDYYKELEKRGHTVIRLEENVGHFALWECKILSRYKINSEFVYTDSDVVPCAFCPDDVVARLQEILNQNPLIEKAGLSLRLDNIPVSYEHRQTAITWEEQFWKRPVARGMMLASIDTTFALYRPFSGWALDFDNNVRTTYPLIADHLGWHVNSLSPTEEDVYYAATAKTGISNWSGTSVPVDIKQPSQEELIPSFQLLHLGSDTDAYPGWLNFNTSLLSFHLPGANTLIPLGTLDQIPSNTIRGIYDQGSHSGLKKNPDEFFGDIHRMAKHGCRYILRIPRTSVWQSLWRILSVRGNKPVYYGGWLITCVKGIALDSPSYLKREDKILSPVEIIQKYGFDEIVFYFLAIKDLQTSDFRPAAPAVQPLFAPIDVGIDFLTIHS